jgi:hypothetical protein
MSLILHEGRIITTIKDMKAMKDVTIPRKKRKNDSAFLYDFASLHPKKKFKARAPRIARLKSLGGF